METKKEEAKIISCSESCPLCQLFRAVATNSQKIRSVLKQLEPLNVNRKN